MAINFKSETVQKHKELADKIKTGLTIEGSNIKETESHSAYFANLPEGLTKEAVEDLSKYNGRFVTAAHVAVGEMAGDAFKADKKLEEVTAAVGFFGKQDTIDMHVSKSKTYQNHMAKDDQDKEITKHLVIKTVVETHSGKGAGLKAARNAMSEEFKDFFSK